MKINKPYTIFFFLVSSALISFAAATCTHRKTNIAPAPAPSSSSSPAPASAPSPSLSSLRAPKAELELLCQKTDHVEECIKSATPFLVNIVTPTSVLKMEIQAIRKGFKDALALAHGAYKGASPDLKGSLDVCVDVYGSGLADTDDSMAAIGAKDKGKLNVVLSAAVSYPVTCDDAFDEMGGEPILKDANEKLGMIASNCLAIAELLEWN